MTGIEFFVDVVASGAILGVGVAESPDQVAHELGPGFVDDPQPGRLRRDYGLVEYSWERRSPKYPWRATGFSVQVHRLRHIAADDRLTARFGVFSPSVPWSLLRARLLDLGYQLVEIGGGPDSDMRRYWLAESRVCIAVINAAAGAGSPAPGEVWSISAPYNAESVAATALPATQQAVKDGLAHLLRLDDEPRRAWLDRRLSPGDANRWLYLFLVIDAKLRDQPNHTPAGWNSDWPSADASSVTNRSTGNAHDATAGATRTSPHGNNPWSMHPPPATARVSRPADEETSTEPVRSSLRILVVRPSGLIGVHNRRVDHDAFPVWPTNKLNARRLGRRLVAEVDAESGRRSFVDITPVQGDDIAPRAEGWQRSSAHRSFKVEQWDYDASRARRGGVTAIARTEQRHGDPLRRSTPRQMVSPSKRCRGDTTVTPE